MFIPLQWTRDQVQGSLSTALDDRADVEAGPHRA
jgi:hypothetical protein